MFLLDGGWRSGGWRSRGECGRLGHLGDEFESMPESALYEDG
jgi:hypothetical protein